MFTIAIEYGRYRTDRAQIFCETLRDPRECLWINFFPLKFFFTIYIKRKMFIIEIEDGVKGICITRIYIVLNKEKK